VRVPKGNVIENDHADEPNGTAAVTDPRSAVQRVGVFLVERFPPAPQLVLMSVLFVAATLMSGMLLAPDVGGSLGDIDAGRAIAGFLGSLLFIVRLRLYDDVKDADTDRVENPTRPIPRGLVSVRELDVTALLVLVVEGLLIASVGPLTFVCWAIAAAWSLLMRVEFFVSRWLEAHVATYAISHMVVMGLIYGALLAIGIDMRGGEATPAELLLAPLAIGAMLAATSIGIGFEWGRKFERYHEVHGERAWTLWMLWPSLGVMAFTYLTREEYPIGALLVLGVLSLVTIFGHALVVGQRDRSGATPERKLRDVVEMLPGVTGLLTYLVLAVAGVVELVGS
jgi:4-hydroxybenzoate polyprenyltransferase